MRTPPAKPGTGSGRALASWAPALGAGREGYHSTCHDHAYPITPRQRADLDHLARGYGDWHRAGTGPLPRFCTARSARWSGVEGRSPGAAVDATTATALV